MGPGGGPRGAAAPAGLAAELAAACDAAERAASSLRRAGGCSLREADAVIDRCLAVSRAVQDVTTLYGAGRLRGEWDAALAGLGPDRRGLAAEAVLAGLAFERALAAGATEAEAEAGARALAGLLRWAAPPPGSGPG